MDISKHNGYRDFVWNVELHQFAMEFIGMWPKTNDVTKNTFTSDLRVSIIFILMTFNATIPLVSALVRVWGDMILMIDNLQVTLPVIAASLKLVIFRWKRTAFLFVVETMAEDWMKLKEDAERDVMKKRARSARLIAICAYVLMIVAFTVVIVLPSCGLPFRYITNITDGDRILPLQTYYFYDTNRSPQFELTLIVQSVTMFFTSLSYMMPDTFLGLLVFHICGQLENFRRRLYSLVLHKDFDCVLRHNIKTHIRLIRFADNIDDIFNLMMLALVIYFAIVFCLYCFLLIVVFTDNKTVNISFARISFAIVGILTFLVNTFLYCGAGEIIANQCEAVYHTLCDLEWYKLESRNQKMLILFMMRVNEPFRISAGKIIPLTMTTFCSLLKTSAGYVSFLLAKQD